MYALGINSPHSTPRPTPANQELNQAVHVALPIILGLAALFMLERPLNFNLSAGLFLYAALSSNTFTRRNLIVVGERPLWYERLNPVGWNFQRAGVHRSPIRRNLSRPTNPDLEASYDYLRQRFASDATRNDVLNRPSSVNTSFRSPTVQYQEPTATGTPLERQGTGPDAPRDSGWVT